MGLNCTHGCWDGAYSAFNRWRVELAHLAGIPLDLMVGYYEPASDAALTWAGPRAGGPECGSPYGPLLVHWIERTQQWLPLSWEPYRSDPITHLLDHSDCDGELDHSILLPLADRLEELRRDVPADRDLGGHVGNFREKTQQFVEGLRLAAQYGENVEFR